MKISYDPEIDALYIRLLDGKHECRSVRLSDEVALNIGAGEKLVGIEILDATSVFKRWRNSHRFPGRGSRDGRATGRRGKTCEEIQSLESCLRLTKRKYELNKRRSAGNFQDKIRLSVAAVLALSASARHVSAPRKFSGLRRRSESSATVIMAIDWGD